MTSTASINISNTTSTIPTVLTTHNTYTMCAWVKTTATNNRWIYQIGDGTGGCRGLWLTTNGSKPHFAYSGSGAFTSNVVVNDGNWHHICFTVNGATSKCYVDGVDYGGSTSTKTDVAGANNIILVFNGSDVLSDFRLYATTLSTDDIKQLYNTVAKVDNLYNLHTFELNEQSKNYLAMDSAWLNSSGTHNNINWSFNTNYSFTLNGTKSTSTASILIWNFASKTSTSNNGNNVIKNLPNGTYIMYTGHSQATL